MSNYPKEEKEKQEKKNDTAKSPDYQSEKQNDDINWSDLKDLSLGEVMEQLDKFTDSSHTDAMDEQASDSMEESVEKLFEDNPILATYLRGHKEGTQVEALKKIEELVKEKETAEKETDSPTSLDDDPKDAIIMSKEDAEEYQEDLEAEETIVEPDEEADEEITNEDASEPTLPTVEVESDSQQVEVDETAELEAPAESTVEETVVDQNAVAKNEQPIAEHQASEPETEGTRQSLQKKKHPKRKWYALAAVLAVGITGGAYYNHVQAVAQAEKEQEAKEKAQLASITSEITELFTDEQQQFLKDTTTATQISNLDDRLSSLKKVAGYKDIKQELADAQEKLTQVEALNEKFTSPILVNGEIQTDAHVKNVDTATFSKLTGNSTFEETYNKAVTVAEKEIANAKSVMANVTHLTDQLSNGTVADTVNQTSYDDVKNQLTTLYDEDLKAKLQTQITPVQTALTKRAAAEKAAREKAAAEQAAQEQAAKQKVAEEQAAQTQATLLAKIAANTTYSESTQILSTNTVTNKENRPIIDSRKSDLANSSSSAWNWGAGMYDFVINRAIAKGYIVQNGFYLERVRIENGEGYYNLYAMNNESSLMKTISAKALPMYIATINAKTGYFKGNGSN
ncbi:cell division site-positioning protein MapZ family protein [Enterococcus italicus]|uniref:cell division site-positioning protein MapZ family protein n=1 Tax=Enterococcus italicus TaxID=246144 RepID=UPI0028A71BBF|nr:cell division site-positioning protein MapZ family protein [Enterococcus italicus]